MRDIKEILGQKWQLGLSHRTIAVALKVRAGAVGETVRRAKQAGLCDFAAVDAMAPSELEAKLYPSTVVSTRPLPDCAWIHRERRLGQRSVSMRQIHVAGEKTFVDYSGRRPCIYNPKTAAAEPKARPQVVGQFDFRGWASTGPRALLLS